MNHQECQLCKEKEDHNRRMLYENGQLKKEILQLKQQLATSYTPAKTHTATNYIQRPSEWKGFIL